MIDSAMGRWASLAGLLLAVLPTACGLEREETPPEPVPDALNLVLVTVDTTRADALGAYGQPLPATPEIDRLAASGVLFEQAMTTNPETLPSHAALFTGKFPFAHGVRSNVGYLLPERQVTLAEALRDHGYHTGAEVAAQVMRKETQIGQGFDHFRDVSGPDVELKVVRYSKGNKREKEHRIRTGANVSDRAIDFLRAHQSEKFFLWLHYFDAHQPYSAPAPFNAKIPQSRYHAEVASADYEIGRVVGEVNRLGLRGRTLIVLTADHGEGLDEHGEPSHSFYVYESTMRVPLIFAGPGLPATIRIPSLVRVVDVAPTVLELMGLPPLEETHGTSLVPLLNGSAADLGLTGYGEATRITATFDLPAIRTLRKGRWKYIHKVNPELYDLEADPDELTNLSAEEPERVAAMRAELEAMLADAPAPDPDARKGVDAETAAQLVALGYAASSPAAELSRSGESLELRGSDPAILQEEIQLISSAGGFLRRGEYASALEPIAILRERNPELLYGMEMEAEALAGLERNAEAIALLQRVLAARPGDREVVYDLATVLRADGQGEEAAKLLSSLVAADPCDPRFRLDHHDVLKELGRYREMMDALADGSDRCPDLVENLNNYAWALATLPADDLRDGSRAVEIMRRVLVASDSYPVAYRDTLAAALAEAGDYRAAIEEGMRALEALRAEEGPEVIAEILEQHLELYRAEQPIRDPAPVLEAS